MAQKENAQQLVHEKFREIHNEDQENVKKAVQGDISAFENLVRKYEKFVCATVFSVVKNREDAFDVAQEVFLKLYHSISSFKGESSFASWLYRIAKNSALDFLRKQKNKQTVSLTAENSDGEETVLDVKDESEKTSPEKALLNKEKSEFLYKAMDMISEEHKEILLLRDINGFTYEEISEILSIEEGTVKSRLFRAREALRKKLIQLNYF